MQSTSPKRKPTGAATTVGIKSKHIHALIVNQVANELVLTTTTTEARIDSRLLARQLGNKSKPVIALIDKYLTRFKAHGQVLFKKADGGRKQGGGMAERYALLNEDQAYFLLSLSRNSETVVNLKVKLVKAFGAARRAADMRQTDYLPVYHALHDQIKTLAAGSPNERFIHINCNKALNKFAGLAAGQRAGAPLPKQALLIVGQMMMTQAMQAANNHQDGFQRAKAALLALTACTMLEAAP